MNTATRENFVLLIALLSVLVFAGGAALFAVGLMLLRREKPKPEPAPKAANRAPHVDVAPAHTERVVTATAVVRPYEPGRVSIQPSPEARRRSREEAA